MRLRRGWGGKRRELSAVGVTASHREDPASTIDILRLICLSIGCIHRPLYLIYLLDYLLSIHASVHPCICASIHACMHLASIRSSIILSSTHCSSINSSVLLHGQPLFLPLEYVSFITYLFVHPFSGGLLSTRITFRKPRLILENQR